MKLDEVIYIETPSATTEEVAQYLGVPKRYIYLYVKKYGMPHFREGRKLKFYIPLVLGWIGEINRKLERMRQASKNEGEK